MIVALYEQISPRVISTILCVIDTDMSSEISFDEFIQVSQP